MFITSVLTLLTPLAPKVSVWLLVATRILEGFASVSTKIMYILNNSSHNTVFYLVDSL